MACALALLDGKSRSTRFRPKQRDWQPTHFHFENRVSICNAWPFRERHGLTLAIRARQMAVQAGGIMPYVLEQLLAP